MVAEDLYIPSKDLTPADRIRDLLGRVERPLASLRGRGTRVVQLLYLLDQIHHDLSELEALGLDSRAERARLATIHRKLDRSKARFLAEAGDRLREERAVAHPDSSQWWWYLDEQLAQRRKRDLRRWLVKASVVIGSLLVISVVYERFIAPPPEIREAFRLSSAGEGLVERGDLRGALVQFKEAASLNSDDVELLVWQGVVHAELGDQDAAEQYFGKARSLHETELVFLLDRARLYLRAGNLFAASIDLEQAANRYPDSGRVFYLRASVAQTRGQYGEALADLEKSSELAGAAGDIQLEATARVQLAMVTQLQGAQ